MTRVTIQGEIWKPRDTEPRRKDSHVKTEGCGDAAATQEHQGLLATTRN